MMIFLPVSYIVKMVVIPLHSLHPCTHQNHVVWSVSRYGAHKPIGFHAPFAIRCCSSIAIVDIDVCIYYPHICTWLVYIMAINIFWIWIFFFEFDVVINVKNAFDVQWINSINTDYCVFLYGFVASCYIADNLCVTAAFTLPSNQ